MSIMNSACVSPPRFSAICRRVWGQMFGRLCAHRFRTAPLHGRGARNALGADGPAGAVRASMSYFASASDCNPFVPRHSARNVLLELFYESVIGFFWMGRRQSSPRWDRPILLPLEK